MKPCICLLAFVIVSHARAEYSGNYSRNYGNINPYEFEVDIGGVRPASFKHMTGKTAEGVDLDETLGAAALVNLVNSLSWQPFLFSAPLKTPDGQKTFNDRKVGGFNVSRYFTSHQLEQFLDSKPYPYACATQVTFDPRQTYGSSNPRYFSRKEGLPIPGQGFRVDWLIAQAMNPREKIYENILGLGKTKDGIKKKIGLSTLTLNQVLDHKGGYGGGQTYRGANYGLEGRYMMIGSVDGRPQSGVSEGAHRYILSMPIKPHGLYGAVPRASSTSAKLPGLADGLERFWRETFDQVHNPDPGQDTFDRNFEENPVRFKIDGGEAIFQLPNGYEAYIAYNDKGELVKKADMDIVQNNYYPSPRGPELVVPRDCMKCHASEIHPAAAKYIDLKKRLTEDYEKLKAQPYRTALEADRMLQLSIALPLMESPEDHAAIAKATHDVTKFDALKRSGGWVGGSLDKKEKDFSHVLPDFAETYEGLLSLETARKELGNVLGAFNGPDAPAVEVSEDEIRMALGENASLATAMNFHNDKEPKFTRRTWETFFCEILHRVARIQRDGSAKRNVASTTTKPGTTSASTSKTDQGGKNVQHTDDDPR